MTANELAERLEKLLLERRTGIYDREDVLSIYSEGLVDGLDTALLLLRKAMEGI